MKKTKIYTRWICDFCMVVNYMYLQASFYNKLLMKTLDKFEALNTSHP